MEGGRQEARYRGRILGGRVQSTQKERSSLETGRSAHSRRRFGRCSRRPLSSSSSSKTPKKSKKARRAKTDKDGRKHKKRSSSSSTESNKKKKEKSKKDKDTKDDEKPKDKDKDGDKKDKDGKQDEKKARKADADRRKDKKKRKSASSSQEDKKNKRKSSRSSSPDQLDAPTAPEKMTIHFVSALDSTGDIIADATDRVHEVKLEDDLTVAGAAGYILEEQGMPGDLVNWTAHVLRNGKCVPIAANTTPATAAPEVVFVRKVD